MKIVTKVGLGFLGLIIIISFLSIFARKIIIGINTGMSNVAESSLPLLLDTEAAAIKVSNIQTYQTLYLKDREEDVVGIIADSVAELKKMASAIKDDVVNNDSTGDYADEMRTVCNKLDQQLNDFMSKFTILKESVDQLEVKQNTMMDSSVICLKK